METNRCSRRDNIRPIKCKDVDLDNTVFYNRPKFVTLLSLIIRSLNPTQFIMKHFIYLLVAIVFAVTGNDFFPEEDNIIVLTDDNFERAIQQFRYLLIEFCKFL